MTTPITLDPIIDSMLVIVRGCITQLGIGFPETGQVYSSTAYTLKGIADTMAGRLVCSGWEGRAATNNLAQARTQWYSVAELEKIDQLIATLIKSQAACVYSTRLDLYRIEEYLRGLGESAAAFRAIGQEPEARAIEDAAVTEAHKDLQRDIEKLISLTQQNTTAVVGLNQRLAELSAKLNFDAEPAAAIVSTKVNSSAAAALWRATTIFRSDSASIVEMAAYCNGYRKWIQNLAANQVSPTVMATHGNCTAVFNSELRKFEAARAEVVLKLEQTLAYRAATLKSAAARLEDADRTAAAEVLATLDRPVINEAVGPSSKRLRPDSLAGV